MASHEPNADGSVATVGLVETPIVLDQAMFQLPAFCGFSPGDDKHVKQLKQGQQVTISGTCKGFKGVGTFLTNCFLVGETAKSDKTIVR
ncbi:MAG: hypothetical protein KDA75_13365 [Planctomycetaceae bacterium]|nr:hypothetical protein [Planctomycetaceae bacterium]